MSEAYANPDAMLYENAMKNKSFCCCMRLRVGCLVMTGLTGIICVAEGCESLQQGGTASDVAGIFLLVAGCSCLVGAYGFYHYLAAYTRIFMAVQVAIVAGTIVTNCMELANSKNVLFAEVVLMMFGVALPVYFIVCTWKFTKTVQIVDIEMSVAVSEDSYVVVEP